MFIILPVRVDYSARRYPVVTFTLMGICTAVYLVTLICTLAGDSEAVTDWVMTNLWLVPGEHHWWTYLTHQFVHAGLFHLLGNMIYLFLFGSCVEDMIGRVRYTIFYLLCGLVAALTHILMTPGQFSSEMPLGGASGAISGCIGGFLLLLLKTHIEFKWFSFFMFRPNDGEFTLPAWLVISFWFLEDFASMILTKLADNGGGGVAFGAHVGGTLAGAAFMSLEKLRMKRTGIDRLVLPDEELEEIRAIYVAAKPAPVVQVAVERKTYRVGQSGQIETQVATPVVLPTATGEFPTIHLSADGTQSGPFTATQVRDMFLSGTIQGGTVYWQEGMEEWRSAEELREPGVAY